MADRGKAEAKGDAIDASSNGARIYPIAVAGIKTGRDFALAMSAIMSDIIDGRVDFRTANAFCNAGGKLLKVVEMERKYGKPKGQQEEKHLPLA